MTSSVGLILGIGWMDFYANHVIICYVFKTNPTYKELQIMLFPLDTLETTVTVAEFTKIQLPYSDFIVNDIVVLITNN